MDVGQATDDGALLNAELDLSNTGRAVSSGLVS